MENDNIHNKPHHIDAAQPRWCVWRYIFLIEVSRKIFGL